MPGLLPSNVIKLPYSKGIDHKTLLAVTNAVVELVSHSRGSTQAIATRATHFAHTAWVTIARRPNVAPLGSRFLTLMPLLARVAIASGLSGLVLATLLGLPKCHGEMTS